MGGGGCSGRQRRDSRRRKTERDTGRDPRDKQISEHTMQFSGSMPLAALSSPSVFLSLPPSAPLLLFQPPLTHSLSPLLSSPLPTSLFLPSPLCLRHKLALTCSLPLLHQSTSASILQCSHHSSHTKSIIHSPQCLLHTEPYIVQSKEGVEEEEAQEEESVLGPMCV